MTTSRRRFLGALGAAGLTTTGAGALSALLAGCDSGNASSGASVPSTAFAPPDATQPWWMQGVFAPVSQEVGATDLEVVGALPRDLAGTFVRNGSNPASGASVHWFMGDGMVHGVRLDGGRAVWYRNRYVDTPILRAGGGLTSAGTPGGPNNQSNVSVVSHGGRLLSLGEVGYPYELDPATLETVGPYDYDGRLASAMTAHPKVDPATGDLHFFGYGFLPPYLTYHVASADGTLRTSEEVDIGRAVMMHDFNVTDRDVVFWDLPVIFDLEAATSGSAMPFVWRPDAGARVGVMPLGGPASAIRWVEIEPCFVYHSTNAYRDGDDVVVDVCRQPSAMTATTDTRPSRVERWRIDTSGADLVLRTETLSEQRMDLPTIDRRRTGRTYRHGWYAEVVSDGTDGTQFPGIIHLDTSTGGLDAWSPGPWLAAGEGVLAATGEGEGEGWLLAFTTDRRTMASSLVVLDARPGRRTGRAGAVAGPCPGRVPRSLDRRRLNLGSPLMSTVDDDATAEYGQRPFEAPPGATEILLVRHGQSAPYREGHPFPLVDGQGDPPLSPLGEWQAQQVAERLAAVEIDAIYVTTLTRTHQTAAPLAARLGIETRVEADLREVHLGEWEGGTFRVMAAKGHPAMVAANDKQDWGEIPGGERSDALRARVRAAIERIHAAHPGERVVAVSHGGAIGAVMAEASGARTFAFAAADNASISHLVVLGDRWSVRRFNDTGHLAGELSAQAEAPT